MAVDDEDAVGGLLDQGAELLLALAQFLLRPPAFGDVDQGRQDRRLAAPIDDHRAVFQPHQRTVPAPALELVVGGRRLAPQAGAEISPYALALVRRDEFLDGLEAQDFVRALESEDVDEGLIDEKRPQGAVHQHSLYGAFDESAEPLLALPERRLGAVAFGDVAQRPQRSRPAPVGDDGDGRVDLDAGHAVLFQQPELVLAGNIVAGQAAAIAPGDELQVLGRDELLQGPVDHLAHLIAQHCGKSVVDERHPAVLGQEHAVLVFFHQGPVFLLGFAKCRRRVAVPTADFHIIEAALDGGDEARQVVLVDEIVGALFQKRYRLFLADGAGNDDERHFPATPAQRLDRSGNVEEGQSMVRQHQVPLARPQSPGHGLGRLHPFEQEAFPFRAQRIFDEQRVAPGILDKQDIKGIGQTVDTPRHVVRPTTRRRRWCRRQPRSAAICGRHDGE